MNGDISFLEFGSIEADTGKSQIFFGKVCGWHFHPMPQGGAGSRVPGSVSAYMATTLDPRYMSF